ncbi:MAG TPA: FHA domain-containing protein [Minicystis sp.]|nr:FHA domain-containing protein [Minicystis sp.]
MPVRLRYLAHDLEVPSGQFVIGRTPDCQLSLDDPLVSRRHALLVVQQGGVFVEDLGSRNGVFVNGTKIGKVARLKDGDVIKIGGQEMTLHGVDEGAGSAPPLTPQHHRTKTMQDLQVFLPPADVAIEDAEAPISDEESMTVVTASPLAAQNPDRRINALSLIGGLADKALALGRADEAERILSRTLLDLRQKAELGDHPSAEVAERAAAYAARLAGATGKGSWVDYVFGLYATLRALVPGKVVDELYSSVRKVKHTDRAVLRAYTALLRDLEAGFGPAERFVQQRIEGLERWIP